MFSIPIDFMEEICLNDSLLLPSTSSPLALQPNRNLMFMMSACCHGSYSVTDVWWLHSRTQAEENLGWNKIPLKYKYSLHPYVLFKKKLVKGCFVKGWPITNTVEMTNIPRANIKKKGDVAPSWIFEECSRFMFLILCYSNEAQLCLQFINWSIPSSFFSFAFLLRRFLVSYI